jgi:hypothetical protein
VGARCVAVLLASHQGREQVGHLQSCSIADMQQRTSFWLTRGGCSPAIGSGNWSSSAYASNQYRALQQFFKWLAAE